MKSLKTVASLKGAKQEGDEVINFTFWRKINNKKVQILVVCGILQEGRNCQVKFENVLAGKEKMRIHRCAAKQTFLKRQNFSGIGVSLPLSSYTML
jgi:hypothetical protein